MTDDAPPAVPDRRDQADWMAVHHANRAVTVAWVSAVVNLLVVFVALGTPLIQNMVEKSAKSREEYNSKISLISEARKSFNDGVESRSDVRAALSPGIATNDPSYYKQRIEQIEEIDFTLANHEREIEFLFAGVSSDIGYRNIAYTMLMRYNHLRVTAKRTKFFLENRDLVTADVAKASDNSFIQSYDDDLRELRLAIVLNTNPKTGTVNPGEPSYGTCLDDTNRVLCEKPLLILR